MLEEISPETFDEWFAWWELDGNVLERIERMLAIGFATLGNLWADGKPFTEENFLLHDRRGRGADADGMVSPDQAAMLFAASMGAKG